MGGKRNGRKLVVLIAILLMLSALAGCGMTTEENNSDPKISDIDPEETEDDEEESDDAEISDSAETSYDDGEFGRSGMADDEDKNDSAETDTDVNAFLDIVGRGTREKISDEEAASLQYMEKVMIEDYYGDMTEYEMYAPVGSINGEGYLSYIDHGLVFYASVYSYGIQDFFEEGLQIMVNVEKEDWEEYYQYSDIQVSEIMQNGDDRYVFLSARGEDYNGLGYGIKKVIYQDVRENSVAIEWKLEITEYGVDSETDLIIDEISKCYGIYLDDLAVNGEWEKAEAERQMEIQDAYEPEEGESELTKADGYQYMGITAISIDDINCPIMLPMGRNRNVRETSASSDMHGVYVHICGYYSKNYQAEAADDADRQYRNISDPDEGNQNVRRSEVMPMYGFNQAVYYVIEYDELDYNGEEYHSRADVYCYIKLDDKCYLSCHIKLSRENYDDATNILLKELETAYGLDLSRYYYEKED